MNRKNIKTTLSLALAITVVIIIINSFLYNFTLWYVADALYVIIPIAFIGTCIRRKSDLLVAIVLLIPALVVGYMAFMGLLGYHHPIWMALNTWQLVTYSYFIGTKLKIKP